jgi:hypothetical protein
VAAIADFADEHVMRGAVTRWLIDKSALVRLSSRPLTFDTKGDATACLALRHSEMQRGALLPQRLFEVVSHALHKRFDTLSV